MTTLEVLPTLAATAGTLPPPGVTLDGFDMLPVLQGRAKSTRTEMFWEHQGEKAARVGNYKWLESAAGSGLYDLARDVGEKHDLSAEKPECSSGSAPAMMPGSKNGRRGAPRPIPRLLTTARLPTGKVARPIAWGRTTELGRDACRRRPFAVRGAPWQTIARERCPRRPTTPLFYTKATCTAGDSSRRDC